MTNYPTLPRFVIRFLDGEPREYVEVIPGGDVQGGLLQGPWLNEALKALISFIGRLEGDTARPALDEGAVLLDPITNSEHAAIERLLALLWQAAANDRLTEAEERMILSIAEMIERSHRETEPGTTPRWKLVGPVRGGLGSLFATVPAGIIAWNEAVPVLQGIDWPNVARMLGHG